LSEWIYGFHAVEGVIKRSPERITALWLASNRRDKRAQEVEALAQTQGVAVTRVERYQLDMEIDGRHQGIAVSVQGDEAVAEVLTEVSLVASVASGRFNLLLVLDGVTDPHNLGACLRSADAAGVHAVVVPKNNSADVNAVVSKVACGAAEVIPLVPVTNLARTLLALQGAGAWIVGTSGDAEQFIYDVDMTGPTVLVMGAEGDGMRRLTTEHCDYLVKLPMAGTVSSLNVSVATGVCLFEIVRQRGIA
jgi:23S rRNA (guanosine2251-2'-O)-methyltransferase